MKKPPTHINCRCSLYSDLLSDKKRVLQNKLIEEKNKIFDEHLVESETSWERIHQATNWRPE